MNFTADFETATWLPDETYVWAWAICEIGNDYNIKRGNTIEEFFKVIEYEKNSTYYFHNLKFDGEFIINYLLNNGFTHVEKKKDKKDKTFSTLISDMGMFYEIEVYFKVGNKRVKKVTFIDSLKIIPFSVNDIAKAFGLPISKLRIDYNRPREKDHILTTNEIKYISNDVKIVAMALDVLFKEDLTRMTSASNSLYDFKEMTGKNRFDNLFPNIPYEIDEDLRPAYRGGFTYVNPIYKEKDVGSGVVLDVNSLYPSVLHDELMPVGEPVYFEGKYEYDPMFPLYVQRITCVFELKKNKIPTIQIKKSPSFLDNEYLESSNGEIVSLTLSSIDLEMFFNHYDVYFLEYHSGYKFRGMKGIFTSYIDKWTEVKIKATKEKNKGMRTLAKLMLNSLYGKFATSLDVQGKVPYIEDDLVLYKLGEKEKKKGLYLPVGIFTTAYARKKTIETSNAIKEYSINKYGKDFYCYSDTDSIHTLLPIEELTKFCDIDDVALGKWKHESTFTRARFVRQKTYLEEIDGKVEITCAGMPERCYKFVEWNNFKQGFTCGGKLTFKHVKGGVILVETDFTIKQDKTLVRNIKEF